jgi:hypothetical protein
MVCDLVGCGIKKIERGETICSSRQNLDTLYGGRSSLMRMVQVYLGKGRERASI